MTQYRHKQCTWATLSLPWNTSPTGQESPITPIISNAVELAKTGYSCQSFFRAADLPQEWMQVAPADDLFLQLPFLEMLEESPPADMEFAYLLFKRQGHAIGIAVCQILSFDAQNQIVESLVETQNWWQRLLKYAKNFVAKRLKFKVLICGNMLITGQHGFAFDDSVPDHDIAPLLRQGTGSLFSQLDALGKRVEAMVVKDVTNQHPAFKKTWLKEGFTFFPFQPNMILELSPQWTQFEDYMNAMSSKYRVRVRRARKAVAELDRRKMDANEIKENRDILIGFYQQIVNKAEFNMLKLHPQHFEQLQNTFPHRFSLWGYFLKSGELVGFSTTILNGNELEAHFLGLSEDANRHYQLYLNMLYDMVDDAIKAGVKQVVFARTAMEIKSSAGATAHQCNCFIQHRCWIMNLFGNQIVKWMEPKVDWTPRHPFKHED